ncbi:MAG: hypothetical protein GTO45_02700 [Candidatus Aminicenantes bacterium]|nr:hypothetical protein [Candidatus Aminicenantes bacterium]NIM77640.1 hypothetical protein [Candidatus Aminicenantes bacterium]NIN16952.1 hypothetical protein [Candidatus Aminicenantes bacterium]NIN40845.1 hypothetical protein [Candidatus Aminicenantes bacterium]NIN83649.1 hypothetical protein [Candidatus Aminicenantes bacterium]
MKKIFTLISTFILFLALIFSNLAYGAIPAWEREALIAFYNSTNGDNWKNNSGWKDDPLEADGFGPIGSEGTWQGIFVSDDHVVGIDLYYNNLTGTIPPELGNLSELIGIFLEWNELSGTIPPELGNLGKMTHLLLMSNRLSGSIPPELGNIHKLAYLELTGNELTGPIPSELGNLSKLVLLFLSDNHLSGSIPATLGNLSHLKSLWLRSNQLSGSIPPQLKNLVLFYGAGLGYNALYTDDDELRIFLTIKDRDWESTQTIAPANVSAAATAAYSIKVSWTPIAYTADNGGYLVYYSTTPGGPWEYAGMTPDKLSSSYDVTRLWAGTTYYFMVKTKTDLHQKNRNTVISEASNEVSAKTQGIPPGQDTPPFGSFDTPMDGSTVVGSIPVTGWALDEAGVTGVKIYREPGPGEGENLFYIGDAVFIEGARPDVEQSYPGYPMNHKAGWGYMMLTNFLPNGGNGTFNVHAIATDLQGNQVTLGIKTIYGNNANAVKPFGAIDTPTQGGPASGSEFVNFGWALTPPPNTIPTDGSTIAVWVDSVEVGNPIYNQCRADIASLFPGYNNSNGAVGYFYLDTTAYSDGVHTIQWTVTDDAGNTDGIGSRYFTIQNSSQGAGRRAQGAAHNTTRKAFREQACLFRDSIRDIPIDYSGPIMIRKGYNKNIEPQTFYPDEDGEIAIKIKALERLEIHLNEQAHPTFSDSPLENTLINRYSGYLMSGESLKILPIGSTFDSIRGVFCWQPGPGFIGKYRFVFIGRQRGGESYLTYITVNIGATSF